MLDPELFKNLHKLKNYKGDLTELEINFVIHDDITNNMTELVPNGNNIMVSNSNVITYLYRYANYKLNETIKRQLGCFMNGFHRVINKKWLKIFSVEEIEMIVNGNENTLDVDDFIYNVQIQGGMGNNYVRVTLRAVMLQWDENTKKKFLKFITSYRNPPLFGFETIEPMIRIRKFFIFILI